MRKRLFIFAAATCFALFAFATSAFAEEPNLTDGPTIGSEAPVQSDGNSNGNVKEDALPGGSDDGLPNEESYSGEGQTSPSAANSGVAKFGGVEYATLQDAIDAARLTSNDATITLQKDLELNNEGLRFIGSDDSNVPWKKITLNADNHSLTLKNLGIYATHCEVTIENCRELTVNAGTNPSDTPNISAVFFCPGTLILNNCKTVNITNLEPNTSGGSGLCIYNGGDLYIQNHTHFTVSGFMNPGPAGKDGCSGIYMDREDGDYRSVNGNIVVSGSSTLEATNCYHSGITANPVDITIRDHSELNVHDNNKDGSGQGGLSSYFGKLSVEGSSRVVSQNNTAMRYSIYVHDLYVDGSEIDASYNGFYDSANYRLGGYGLAFSGTGILKSGAKVTATGNWGPGVAVAYYYHFDDKHNYEYDYPGSLIVEDGATISSCRNYNRGLANEWQLTIRSGAKVYLNENLEGGLDNYPDATATVENGANLVITGNGAYGIKNGNAGFGDGSEATLTLGSGTITDNNKASTIPYHKGGALGVPYHNDCGGGICNENGKVTVSTSAVICNNKATVAGDDLYNYEDIPQYNLSGNIFNITTNPTDTKAVPGASGAVLKDDNKFIDYWYRDGKDNRWNEKDARQYTEISLAPGEALKAAHGINAPTPSPKPAEPTAAPTAVPTAAPTAAPTTAPTVAPTAAPTTAPADNTATAAPATPAPTAQPTVTATPAPTAQASGVIPQTGDSSSPALFSILTLGSITALCVLQKRRKSK